jgi:hypothetical protein
MVVRDELKARHAALNGNVVGIGLDHRRCRAAGQPSTTRILLDRVWASLTRTRGRSRLRALVRLPRDWLVANVSRSDFSTGSVQTDTLVTVETLVYSLRQDKLLWAGTGRTSNPEGIQSLIYEIADAVASQMSKQGLIAR